MLQQKVKEIIERSDFKNLENKRKLPPLNILGSNAPNVGNDSATVTVGSLSTHTAFPSTMKRTSIGSIGKSEEDKGQISHSKTTLDLFEDGRRTTDRRDIFEAEPPRGIEEETTNPQGKSAYKSLLLLGADDTPETSHHEIHKQFHPTHESHESKEEDGNFVNKKLFRGQPFRAVGTRASSREQTK